MKRIAFVFALLALTSSQSWAQSQLGQVRLDGFATLGMSTQNTAQVRQHYTLKEGADWLGESRAGLQGRINLNDYWSITAQAVAKTTDEDWEKLSVRGEWLFASYRFFNNQQLRFGRLRLPLFMLSEQLDVGNAYAMARLPTEVYGMTPTNAYEGVDLLLTHELSDEAELVLQPYAGQTRFNNVQPNAPLTLVPGVNVPGTGTSELFSVRLQTDQLHGVSLSYRHLAGLVLRASYMSTRLTDETGTTKNLALIPSQAGRVVDNTQATFQALGASYQWQKTQLIAEMNQRIFDASGVADTLGWYLMLNHQLSNRWSTYVSYASIDSSSKTIKGTPKPILQQDTLAMGIGYRIDTHQLIKAELSQVRIGNNNTSSELVADTRNSQALAGTEIGVLRVNYNIVF